MRLAPDSCSAVLLPDDPERYDVVLIRHEDGYPVGEWVTMTDGQVCRRPDVLLPFDGRGYRLRHVKGRYLAGCRDFTAAEAVAHWSNPNHPAPASAARLLAAVQAHIASTEAAK